jgi:hypothetical protein
MYGPPQTFELTCDDPAYELLRRATRFLTIPGLVFVISDFIVAGLNWHVLIGAIVPIGMERFATVGLWFTPKTASIDTSGISFAGTGYTRRIAWRDIKSIEVRNGEDYPAKWLFNLFRINIQRECVNLKLRRRMILQPRKRVILYLREPQRFADVANEVRAEVARYAIARKR